MFGKSSNKKDLKEVIVMSKKILKLLYVFLIIIGTYILLKIANEIKLFQVISTILKILAPLFIGVVVAWLLNPVIKWLQKNGIRRKLAVVLSYGILLVILYLIISSILPLLYKQVIELVSSLPSVFESVKAWIDGAFDKLNGLENINIETTKTNLFNNINSFASNLYVLLPTKVLSIITAFISGIGTFLIGLLISFFLLISTENADTIIYELIPQRYRNSSKTLFGNMNKSLRNYVNGALIDAFVVFVISTVAFAVIGVQSPILFGLFCGVTNVIPYVGPYIGGAPAVLVAFSQGTGIGIITLIAIVVIQLIEGNILQTLIISKTTKLNPVSIILGLLLFGHFFGIIGMLLSTPIIGVCKVAFKYFDDKYNLLKKEEEIDE